MKDKKFPSLNSIRAIACLIICFFYHYSWLLTDGYGLPFPILPEYSTPLYVRGYYCVELFFVLSGFLMAFSYKEKLTHASARGGGRLCALGRYLWGRMSKMYPLLLTTLTITTLLQFQFKHLTGRWFYVENVNIYTILMSVFNVSSGWFVNDVNLNMPVWYVSVLMLCYIIYWFVCRYAKTEDGYRIASAIIVLFGIRGFLVPIWKPFMYENSLRGYYCFFIGVLLYELYQWIEGRDRWKAVTGWISFAFLSLIMILCAAFSIDGILGNAQLMFGAVLCPCILWSALNVKLLRNLLSIPPIAFLGNISTSIYF